MWRGGGGYFSPGKRSLQARGRPGVAPSGAGVGRVGAGDVEEELEGRPAGHHLSTEGSCDAVATGCSISLAFEVRRDFRRKRGSTAAGGGEGGGGSGGGGGTASGILLVGLPLGLRQRSMWPLATAGLLGTLCDYAYGYNFVCK